MRTYLRGKVTLLFLTVALLLAGTATAAIAAELLTAEVDTDTNAAAIEVEQGKTANFNIQLSAGGNLASATAINPATAAVHTSYSLSNPSGTVLKTSGTFSSPNSFWGGSSGVATWTGAPAPYSVPASVSVASNVPVGNYTYALSDTANTTQVTNQSGSGGKLADDTATTITIKVIAPSDTTKPTLNLPANITQEATGANGAAVTFTATADDANPAHPAVTCSPASGSTFAIGTTTVNCSATDAANNTANGSFNVTVQDTLKPTNIQFVGNINDNDQFSFGNVPPSPTCTATDSGSGLNSAGCVVTGYSNAVGTHTLTATATDKAGNEATATRNYTVVKADQAPLTVTSPNSGTYGEHLTIDTSGGTTNGAVSFQATGACQIDNDNKLEITDGTGTCSVTATMAGNANYNDVSSDPPHSVTVNKRSVTVTADAKSKTYGDDDPALTYKLTNGSLVNSDGFSGDLSRATGETVAGSPYAIQQGTLSLPASKYILNYEGANFTINARPITVTPDSGQSKVYGENDPTTLTYKLASGSTLAPGDTLADVTTGALTRASGENVGTYAIQQGSLAAANNNYNLSFVGSGVTFEITKAPITIKANDASRYYSEPDPTFGYTIVSGSFKNGDLGNGVSVDLSTTATATSQAGSYDINVELSGPKAGNYNLTAQKGTLTIKAWTNKGFFSPVDYGTTQNTVKGGSTVPLKFQVFQGTQQITNTAYVSGLKPVVTSCATGAPIDSIEELATGGTNLRYDTTGGQFIFNWQTPKKPGTCYNVTVQMVDGTQIPVAKFWLK